MSKSKNVHKLTPDNETDFHLLGIASHENDYRISWALNEALNLRFVKSINHISFNKRISEDQEFSTYISQTDEYSPVFKLISNRCENGFLLEEMNNIDYLLIINNIESFPIDNLISQIRGISFISTVFSIDIKTLKSKYRIT